jgi:lysophospholipase L1-like esterase
MKYEPRNYNERKTYVVDTLKLKYFERLIQECKEKKITLIFATSPIYNDYEASKYNIIRGLAKKYDIPYLLYFDYSPISNNKDFFYDRTHMNRSGATEYSKMIAHELKHIILNK